MGTHGSPHLLSTLRNGYWGPFSQCWWWWEVRHLYFSFLLVSLETATQRSFPPCSDYWLRCCQLDRHNMPTVLLGVPFRFFGILVLNFGFQNQLESDTVVVVGHVIHREVLSPYFKPRACPEHLGPMWWGPFSRHGMKIGLEVCHWVLGCLSPSMSSSVSPFP